MEYLHIFAELVVGFAALFLITKFLGKTQITQITTFDFVSALVLGELVGNALFDEKIGLGQILFAVFLWGILIYFTEYLTQRFKRMRRFLEGEPSIVIKKGQIVYDSLKKNHLDINQLQHLLRSKDIFSIRECEYAILETDGTVSVLKKPPYSFPAAKDFNIQLQPEELPVTLVLDGEIVLDNLHMIHWDENKLQSELKGWGAETVKDVLYAEWKKGEPLHVQTF
ncbi:DUF421 domain-containing protein [Bacillus infantis]|uniref:DUF421 domain-containing protein n=1 Tax=Bacillus infantis TaxID=324767 RepID=UPI0021552419|nr:DUF421 domain-containing protein [Bacillus infantis]MCR6610123.1 DUF421 domain-containing protein [Bacillus infantis]